MRYRWSGLIALIFLLLPAGCGYRFVDPLPASDHALVSVRNATSETGLAFLLEEELRKNGRFGERSANRLSVAVTDFTERVESVSSDGTPVRQVLAMEVAWKVEVDPGTPQRSGRESASRSYPYSSDLPTLDFNRNAALRLLVEKAARSVLESLGGAP